MKFKINVSGTNSCMMIVTRGLRKSKQIFVIGMLNSMQVTLTEMKKMLPGTYDR